MKRNFFLILAIVITACSTPPTQVTVTSEVTVTLPPTSPTPVPTASPESLLPSEIQAKFDQAGIELKDTTNFKKDGNDYIFSVSDNDGKITEVKIGEKDLDTRLIIVGNQLRITSENSINTFWVFNKDEETQKWIVEETKSYSQAKTDFAKYYFELKPEYKIIEKGQIVSVMGPVSYKDTTKSEIIYEDGLFSLNFAFDEARKLDLVKTNIDVSQDHLKAQDRYVPISNQKYLNYFPSLNKELQAEFVQIYGYNPLDYEYTYTDLMLDPNLNAWGGVMRFNIDSVEKQFLFFETSGGIIINPIIPSNTPEEIIKFWIGRPKP